ncbi:MAG: acyl-CoA dehydratase activase [Pseudomonadota bacterium]
MMASNTDIQNAATAGKVYAGIDVGASRTKVVLLDAQKNIIGHAVRKSGTDFADSSSSGLAEAMKMAGITEAGITAAVSTGYGRRNVAVANESKTEISCHGKGCFHHHPRAQTIIDIGGQDNKIIKMDDAGRRTGFKMNRKCAAGTGAFLEEMAVRLDLPLEAMNAMAEQSENMVELGSFCTVFSATEVLEKIRAGRKVPDIVKGLFLSMIKRVLEMDALTETVVMTGGVVAHNPYLVTMAAQQVGRPIVVPPQPQLTGALGAALYAMEENSA